jgi:hypothetical protein
MRKVVVISVVSLLSWISVVGQGVVKGKITNELNEPVIAASVYLESNESYGVYSDTDGNYEIELPHNTPQRVVVSYLGYSNQTFEVTVKKGQVYLKNIKLVPSQQALNTVVVTGKANLSNDMALEKMRMKTAASIDYISAATISKTGDANVIAAVSRVSGVSTYGGFITVRGIGDRYIRTTINGMSIPTLDPFTNNIKLDMFPTSLINNVIITKTYSADLPGDWAGAFLSVETKTNPNKLIASYESSYGYNSQTTFKEILTTQKSKTDWLGYDNGFREYDHDSFVNAKMKPETYDQFVALGLGDYFSSIGVTDYRTWNMNPVFYTKMGLIEMGLLDKSQINDNEAYLSALSEFKSTYSNQAFEIINKEASESFKRLPNTWTPHYRKAYFNSSQSISIGNEIPVFNRPFGYLVNIRYYNSNQYDPNSVSYRLVNTEKAQYDSIHQQVCKETNGWSGLATFSYKLHRYHTVSALVMPNINGANNIRIREYYDLQNQGAGVVITTSTFYEERKQIIYQLKTEHEFPATLAKITTQFSYTDGASSAPDFKDNSYLAQRMFRYLDENTADAKLHLEYPIMKSSGYNRLIKAGASYQYTNRQAEQRLYYLGVNTQLLNGRSMYDIENHNIITVMQNDVPTSTMISFYQDSKLPINQSFGFSEVSALYGMVDYPIQRNLRAIGGVRYEDSYMFTDVNLYHELGLSPDDERRRTTLTQVNKPGKVNENKLLPFATVIYKVQQETTTPLQLKLNYSKTLARPSIREISDISLFDFELRKQVSGNYILKMVEIQNYDIRAEYYHPKGNSASVSLFAKNFKNHIELVDFDEIGYVWVNNLGKSWLRGVELEGTVTILKGLDFKSNVTLVQSQSTFSKSYTKNDGSYVYGDTVTRSMFGQAPYVINGILTYTNDSLGATISLSYNLQGPRLVITGSGDIPDIYERERHLLDCKLSKKFGKHFSASFTVKDILNTAVVRTYRYNNAWLMDYDRYRYGTAYSVGLSYKL